MPRNAPLRVAFAAYGGGHIRALLPVVETLRDRGDDVSLLALTTAARDAEAAGVGCFTPKEFLEDEDFDRAIINYGQDLAADLPRNPRVSCDDTVAYLGLGYKSLVDDFGSAQAKIRYQEAGRAAFDQKELARRYISKARPDIVVATNAPRAERSVIEVARKARLPTVCVVDLMAPPSEPWLYAKGYADRICVINRFVRDRLVKGGQEASRIVITGNPSFLPLFAAKPRSRGPREALRVLFISQELTPIDRSHRQSVRAQMQAIAHKRGDWSVRVRHFPNEMEFGWVMSPLTATKPGTTVMDDLANSDVVVTHGSTMGVEAAIMGIPVVQPLGSLMAERAPFHDAGLSIGVRNVSELEGAIERAGSTQIASSGIPHDPVERIIGEIDALGRGQP